MANNKRNKNFWEEEILPKEPLICPLCGREMIEGPTTDRHHLVPKSRKGKETVLLHMVCHRKIHSLFTEKEIATKYYTIELLRENSEIQKFTQWVSKKHPGYMDAHRDNVERKHKRNKR